MSGNFSNLQGVTVWAGSARGNITVSDSSNLYLFTDRTMIGSGGRVPANSLNDTLVIRNSTGTFRTEQGNDTVIFQNPRAPRHLAGSSNLHLDTNSQVDGGAGNDTFRTSAHVRRVFINEDRSVRLLFDNGASVSLYNFENIVYNGQAHAVVAPPAHRAAGQHRPAHEVG